MKLCNAILLAVGAQAGIGSRVVQMVQENRFFPIYDVIMTKYFFQRQKRTTPDERVEYVEAQVRQSVRFI